MGQYSPRTIGRTLSQADETAEGGVNDLETVKGELFGTRMGCLQVFREIAETALEAQGEWASVTEEFAPESLHPYKQIVEMCRGAITTLSSVD